MVDETGPDEHPTAEPESPELAINFKKTSSYRSVHVDGAYGGATPSGLVAMSLFAERYPVPRRVWHDVSVGGRIGDEFRERREGEPGIVRELEVTAFMTPDVAKELGDWLLKKADEARNRKVPKSREELLRVLGQLMRPGPGSDG